jgi:hypothetical protein
MRAVTVLILIMAAAITAMVTIKPSPVDAGLERWSDVDAVRESLATIRQRILLRTALDRESQRVRGHPDRVEPAWFENGVPGNPWFGNERPWMEIAGDPSVRRDHPQCIVAVDPGDGAFWYNPANGVVRARVPAGLMDADAIALYNAANDTQVTSILP